MIGKNEMTLNAATMVEIVQYWLDNKFLHKDARSPRVSSVRGRADGCGHVFDVALEAVEVNGV